jgi:putative spermidine/putrescine transport system permease protein
VPIAPPGILAGALTVVTLSNGDFNLIWMPYTPYLKTLLVPLWQDEAPAHRGGA